MRENDYIDALRERLSGSGSTASDDLATLSLEAVKAFPFSSELWVIRGDALYVGTDVVKVPLSDEILNCYMRAIALDENNAEAWESVAAFMDTARDDYVASADAYRRAIALGGAADSFAGLARVLAQTGKVTEALALLEPARCPYYESFQVKETRREIEEGIWSP